MSIVETNKDIKIPAQHYVGFNKRGAEEVPLGFMTPEGTDDSATKRKATVDQWARGYGNSGKVQLPAKTLNNKPLSGFKFGNSVSHGYGWGQGNVKWRVEDPRGFELEISSPNLAQIMAVCTIENGEILEQCIWGRLKAENILIPVSSDVYKAATANTERANKTASMKDLKPGFNVVLQNGIEGRYLGAHYSISADSGVLKCSDKKRHYIVAEDAIHDIASLKLSEITAENELTIDAAEIELNRIITERNGKETNYYRRTGHVTNKAFTETLYEMHPAKVTDFTERGFVGLKIGDVHYLADTYYLNYIHQTKLTANEFEPSEFSTGNGLRHKHGRDARNWSGYGSGYSQLGRVEVEKTELGAIIPLFKFTAKAKTTHSGFVEISF